MLSTWRKSRQRVCIRYTLIRMYLQIHLRLYATLISYELFCIVYVWSSGASLISNLNYVANITEEYSFINLTDLEMYQVLFKELLIQTPSKGLLSL